MDRVRLGIIGCGDIAFRSYLPATQELAERVVLVAACDTDRARAERVKVEYGAEVALTDADQMLAHGNDPEAYKEWDTLSLENKLAAVKEALQGYF